MFISACLFLWSKSLVHDPIFDDLAKYVFANQVISDVCFTLNQAYLLEIKSAKPAHRPNTKDEIYLNTLMVYLESGDVSKASKKLKKDRVTIRNHLKMIVGNNYSDLHEDTHPHQKKIKTAYDIWKSIKK